MSKLANLNPEVSLYPFKAVLGESYGKIVADVKSWLGKFEKDIKAEMGEWKAGAAGKLRSKEGYTLQLPLNDPRTTLLCFGMRLNEIASAGKFEVSATLPKDCVAWIEQHGLKSKNSSATAGENKPVPA